MKILHIINDADAGGAQSLLEALADEWPSDDELHLVVLMDRSVLSRRLDNVFDSVTYLGISRTDRNVLSMRRRLQRVIDALRPDLIHSHLFQADLLSLLIHSRGAARVSTIHTSGMTTSDPRLSRGISHLVGRSSRRFNGLVATDASCAAFMAGRHYRLPDRVILNAAPQRTPITYRTASTNFLHLARWHPMKGHDALFEAFREFAQQHPEWTLTCAGPGVSVDNPAVLRAAEQAGFDLADPDCPLTLLGPVDDVGPLLAAAGALIVSSKYGETMPMVSIEAIDLGVPVIATDVGGLARSVVDHRFLISPGSASALSRAMSDFAALSLNERSTLSRSSLARARAEFSVAARVQEYRSVYADAHGPAGRDGSSPALRDAPTAEQLNLAISSLKGPDIPMVTVVLPLRRAAEFVATALEQVLNQTFKDWELVIVLDGPDRATEEILNELQPHDRIRLIRLEEPQGVAASRNLAVRQARGAYVWFADADDSWSPMLLESMHRAIASGDVDLVICRSQERLPGGEIVAMPTLPGSAVIEPTDLLQFLVAGRVTGHLWNKLYSVKLLGSEPFPAQRSRSDLAGMLRLLDRARNIRFVDEVLYTYMVRSGSVINGRSATPRDLLACGDEFEALVGRLPVGAISEGSRLEYLYNAIYFKAIAEVWRFGGSAVDGDQVVRAARLHLTRDGIRVLWTEGHRRTAVMAAVFVLFPWPARKAFTLTRASRWRSLSTPPTSQPAQSTTGTPDGDVGR